MARTYAYSADFDKELESLFKDAKLLGEGHNGIVYEVPGNKAIKIFTDKNICKSEADILYKVKKSKYFPRIYKNGEYYILREMVNGKRLDHYIQENGLSQQLIYNLYRLINEFKALKFTKLDARCRDIYVNENERVSEPLEADEVCVKIEYDFSYTATTIADKADFYYSTDNGITWIKLGKQLNVTNDYTTE